MDFNTHITSPHIPTRARGFLACLLTFVLDFSLRVIFLSPLLLHQCPLGGSISPCYRACETARWRQAFVCNNGFSPFSFVGFLFFLPLHIIFSGLICCDKSAVLYYGLINWNITIWTERVVLDTCSDRNHAAVFGFIVNKVPFLLKWLPVFFIHN